MNSYCRKLEKSLIEKLLGEKGVKATIVHEPKRSPKFRQFINQKYGSNFTPEEIFGYIYAILHNIAYRKKYNEFLKIDYPCIPFVDDKATFEKLSRFGWELVQAHLMKKVPDLGLGKYQGTGNHTVEKPNYVDKDGKLYINKTQFFSPIPKDVWEFHIGGYQVIDKYLKSRIGRQLTFDEIETVEKITNILAFTIKQMQKFSLRFAQGECGVKPELLVPLASLRENKEFKTDTPLRGYGLTPQ